MWEKVLKRSSNITQIMDHFNDSICVLAKHQTSLWIYWFYCAMLNWKCWHFAHRKGSKLLPFEHLYMLSIATVWWHVIENSLNFQFKIIYCHQIVKFNFPPQHRCCLCVKNVEHTTVMKFRKKKCFPRLCTHIIAHVNYSINTSKPQIIENLFHWNLHSLRHEWHEEFPLYSSNNRI